MFSCMQVLSYLCRYVIIINILNHARYMRKYYNIIVDCDVIIYLILLYYLRCRFLSELLNNI